MVLGLVDEYGNKLDAIRSSDELTPKGLDEQKEQYFTNILRNALKLSEARKSYGVNRAAHKY